MRPIAPLTKIVVADPPSGNSQVDVLRTKERRDPIQTYPYRSPEIFYKVPNVNQAIDMWSMGIVF